MRLEIAPDQNPIDNWLTNTKPKKRMVFTPYEIVDRNLKILMERYDIDKGNFLVGDYITFLEEGKPHVIFYPLKNEWMLIDKQYWNLDKRYKTFKGGARKFLNWYDKQ